MKRADEIVGEKSQSDLLSCMSQERRPLEVRKMETSDMKDGIVMRKMAASDDR